MQVFIFTFPLSFLQNSGAAAQPAAAPAAPAPAASNGGGAGNGTDYSQQWAEYYRSIGKIKEAEQIEQQMKQKVNFIN